MKDIVQFSTRVSTVLVPNGSKRANPRYSSCVETLSGCGIAYNLKLTTKWDLRANLFPLCGRWDSIKSICNWLGHVWCMLYVGEISMLDVMIQVIDPDSKRCERHFHQIWAKCNIVHKPIIRYLSLILLSHQVLEERTYPQIMTFKVL